MTNTPNVLSEMDRMTIQVGNENMPIDLVNSRRALEAILTATDSPWSYVVTPNAQHLQLLRDDPTLALVYADASMSLPDGWPVAALCSMITRTRVERVPGSNLLEAVLTSAGKGRPIVFVGGESGSAYSRLAARAAAAGWLALHEPAPRAELQDPEDRARLVLRVARSAHGGIAVIGIGAPRQEILAREICEQPGSGVALCLGMSINFSSGATRRAPAWVQRLGLEWAHRALQDPKRLAPRYAANFVTLLMTTRENALR